jgi:hypothetical protein
MKQAHSLQNQHRKHGSSATSAFSFAEPTRLFAPIPSGPTLPHERQERPAHVAQFKHSFDRISIHPPIPEGGAGHEAEQSGELSDMQQTEKQPSSVQRKETKKQPMPQKEEPLQRRATHTRRAENHTGLPDALKAGIESLSGIAMNDVGVHYNSAKPAQVGALAYTQGTEIHVGPGQEQHLPHEAWHVVQQKQGRVQPTMQMKGVAINDDDGLEREADVMGAKAVKMAIPEGTVIENTTHRTAFVNRANKTISRVPVVQRQDSWDPAANAFEVAEANAQNARLGPNPPHSIAIGPRQQPGPPPTTMGNQKHFDADMLREVRAILNYLPPEHIIGNPALIRVVMEHPTAQNPGISNFDFGTGELHIIVPFDASSWIYLSMSKWPVGDLATTPMTNIGYSKYMNINNPHLGTKWHETFNRDVVGTGSITNKIAMLGENFVRWMLIHETGHSVDEAIGFTRNQHYRQPALGGWLIHDNTDTTIAAMKDRMYNALGLQNNLGQLDAAFLAHTGSTYSGLLDRVTQLRDPSAFSVANKKAARAVFERGGSPMLGGAIAGPVANGAWKAEHLEKVVLEGLESPWQKGGKGGIPLGNRTYQFEYQYSRWVSYDSAKYALRSSNYQYSGPLEWFAESYAHYFSHRSWKFWRQAASQWGTKLKDTEVRDWFRANLDPINGPGNLITANVLQQMGPAPVMPAQNAINVPSLSERVWNSLRDLTVTVTNVGTSGLFRLLSTVFLLPPGILKYLAGVPLEWLWRKILGLIRS